MQRMITCILGLLFSLVPLLAEANGEHAGRRLQALEQRNAEKQSLLIPPRILKLAPIDLRSSEERAADIQKERRAKQGQSEKMAPAAPEKPLIRRRARGGGRKDALKPPICNRRIGLDLIQCLQHLGIEVSPQTVDAATWQIYEGMRGEKTE